MKFAIQTLEGEEPLDLSRALSLRVTLDNGSRLDIRTHRERRPGYLGIVSPDGVVLVRPEACNALSVGAKTFGEDAP